MRGPRFPNSLEWGDQCLFYLPKPDAAAPVPPPVWAVIKSDLTALKRAWQPVTGRDVSKCSLCRRGEWESGCTDTSGDWFLFCPHCSRDETDIYLTITITRPFQLELRTWEGKCRSAEEALIFQHHILFCLVTFSPHETTHAGFLDSTYSCGPLSLITHIK